MEKTRIAAPAPQGTHEARAVRANGNKSARAQDAEQADGQGGGFALLLAALDGGTGAQPGGAAMQLDAANATVPDAPLLEPGTPDAAALAPWMLGLQSTAAHVEGTALRWTPGSLVGETAMLDGAAETAALNGRPQGTAAAAALGRGAVAQVQPWQPTDGAQGATGMGRGHVAAGAAPVAVDATVATPVAPQAAGVAASERRDALQAMPQMQARGETEPAAPAQAAAGLAAATEYQPGTAQANARPGDGQAPAGSGEHQATETQPLVADAAPAGMAGAEDQLAEQIAEQVSYWVHHKTQNAELTLDQDGRPVDVRVALTGDQAHVSLRSDQPQAREWLDASRDQLQDMLQRQGLQLAGMTVGAGAGNGAGARQDGRQDGRQGAQRASVQAALPVGAAARGAGVSERAVDIFV